MKVKDGFVLRQIAETWVVVPIGQRVVEFNGLVSLSESAALLWSMLEKGAKQQELLDALLTEYKIDEETALIDIESFIDCLREKGFLEE